MSDPSRLIPSRADVRPIRSRVVRRTRRRASVRLGIAVILILACMAARHEVRTSALGSAVFSAWAPRLSYQVEEGPGPPGPVSGAGPFDERRGYTLLPEFEARLLARGYRIAGRARLSPAAAVAADFGIGPPYPEPPAAGLVIRDAAGRILHDPAPRADLFGRFEDIPPLIVASLLHLENRALLDPAADPRANPAVDWDRLARAGLSHVKGRLGLPARPEGGSTLATQMEKYRHSPGGRTGSPLDKLRQMTAASLRAYRHGPDTRVARRGIVLDYLNTMPLAAAPGFGEVHGLGQGLRAWFGSDLDAVLQGLDSPRLAARAAAYKQALALIYATRAPGRHLIAERAGLDRRLAAALDGLRAAGVIDADLALAARGAPLRFAPAGRATEPFPPDKGAAAARTDLLRALGLPGLYDLDRIHVDVETTIDGALQESADRLFRSLRDPAFLDANGLKEARLLSRGDPGEVVYSLLLYESTPRGNLMRVRADSFGGPFDVNGGMRLELGSTAKLRAAAHYLEIVAGLYDELSPLDPAALGGRVRNARDPITRWAARSLGRQAPVGRRAFLERALERVYSASPAEVFFTGGGDHLFGNHDPGDDDRALTVREGLARSTNLVFIRLMRDLVRYHEARLPYDARALLAERDHPGRRLLLEEIGDEEGRLVLARAFGAYAGRETPEILDRLLGRRARSARHLAILHGAWNPEADAAALAGWLEAVGGAVPPARSRSLAAAHGGARLTLLDRAHLLGRHPLEVFCAGELLAEPRRSWEEILARSAGARREAASWLLQTRRRRAQDLRLRARIERDAFERMAPAWRRLGFPFERLVPSLASAIGSSGDRPSALADLMGIILNDGRRRPERLITRLEFAPGTPYHTVFEPAAGADEPVLRPDVAGALRDALALVVEEGTARRVRGAFRDAAGAVVPAGGKTGSGDNRHETVGRGGRTVASRAISRTAAFVFHVGDRHYGVVTASVAGPAAGDHRFTSALPLAVLKILAPEINTRLAG
jgi:membrane peptidoglycan carboxypeptidase